MTEQFIVFDTEYASWQGFLDAPEEEKKKDKDNIRMLQKLFAES